jgi:hypothetical protein
VQFTFKETPDFVSTKGALTDEELRAVQDELLRNPEAGDRVSGTNFRKLRVRLAGSGKRGGGRVIYYYAQRAAVIYLMFFYAKSEAPDLSPAGKKYLQQVAEKLDRETR